jgi:enamine deaminase RidA (YjgF/YER057c/UK114 family)
MKCLVLTLFLIGSVAASAQMKYIDPSVQTGSSAAVIVDAAPLVHTAQIFPFNAKGELTVKGDIRPQLQQVFSNAAVILNKAGSDLDHLVKLNLHISNEKSIPEIEQLLAVKFKGTHKPAVTYITQQLWNGAAIAADMVAVSRTNGSKVQYIAKNNSNSTANAAAILPQGGVTYISGQAIKGNLQEGTHGTLQQLDASLKHLGMGKQDVVQLKAYLNSTADIGVVEKELAAYFPAGAIPPIVYVEWISKEYEIEIELIAASPAATTMRDTAITFLDLPGMVHSPLYSKAVQVNKGKKIYFSGLYGAAPGNAQAQTEELFMSLKKLLQATGSDFTHLVKATYFHSDVDGSAALGVVRPKYYDPNRAPAATKAQLKIMPFDKRVSVDMIGLVR